LFWRECSTEGRDRVVQGFNLRRQTKRLEEIYRQAIAAEDHRSSRAE
jgi:hypothetical protein